MLAAALLVTQIVVRAGTPVPTLAAALVRAHPGDTITIGAGTYPTNGATVTTPRLLIRGEGWPVLDGEGAHEILVIAAEGVRVEGILFRGAGVNMTRDQAAVKVVETGGCRIGGNRFDGNFFGVYLQRAHDCVVHGNVIHGTGNDEARNGNGIHLWNATDVVVDSNTVDGHRDGIYLEFAHGVRATGNRSGHNRRYGLHFMFSNDCSYQDNTFDGNGAGVAVMYSREVTLTGNRFIRASGPSAYGLLLKEIRDSRVEANEFIGNTVALYTEGASRNAFAGNTFRDNGWGVRLLASSEENVFTANRFDGNSFDVTTNGRSNSNTFRGNRWDRYDGYDLDRDGVGDVPFRPVRRFALLVEQHESAILLLRSPFADLLDLAEAVFPVLTPETLVDERPVAPRGR
ncbi:MAG TPA: nitrous oxide reductase family maturation protein NosD [Gemmatimonadales bacterium]|nr:nitrous oxide reductase family maturation protein NosD [Gemmatimonadales bacterium]